MPASKLIRSIWFDENLVLKYTTLLWSVSMIWRKNCDDWFDEIFNPATFSRNQENEPLHRHNFKNFSHGKYNSNHFFVLYHNRKITFWFIIKILFLRWHGDVLIIRGLFALILMVLRDVQCEQGSNSGIKSKKVAWHVAFALGVNFAPPPLLFKVVTTS